MNQLTSKKLKAGDTEMSLNTVILKFTKNFIPQLQLCDFQIGILLMMIFILF